MTHAPAPHRKNVLGLGLAFFGLKKVCAGVSRKMRRAAGDLGMSLPRPDGSPVGGGHVSAGRVGAAYVEDEAKRSSTNATVIGGLGKVVYTSDGVSVEERLRTQYEEAGQETSGPAGEGNIRGRGGTKHHIPHPDPSAYPFWPLEDLLEEPYSTVAAWRGRDPEGRALLVVEMGKAVDMLSYEQKRKMEPVIVSQCYHGIGALCLEHDPSTPQGQIGVLVDLKGLSAFKLPPLDVIQNGIVALGQFFGHRAGCYYLINTPRGVDWAIKAVGMVMGHEQRRRLKIVKPKERDEILCEQAATHLGWPCVTTE